MDLKYEYCNSGDECLHRRGCKRWLGNYQAYDISKLTLVSYIDCLCGLGEPFNLIDRFRLSK